MSRMNRTIASVVVIVFATRLEAGVTYRSETTTTGVRSRAFNGIVKTESGQSRFTVTKSDEKMFEAGSVILSSGKDSNMTVLNPAKGTYYVLDFAKVASSVAETQKQFAPWLSISKPVVTVKSEGPGGIVEGYPTQRWLVDTSMEMKMKTSVVISAHLEILTTEKLPAAASSMALNSLSPDDPVFGAIRDAYAKIKGFPLRSVTVTKMTTGGSTTTTTSRTNVTAIHVATFPPSDFAIPAGYKRVDSPIDAMLNAFGSR
jgi:Domain of unknown function (DUF4412)